MMQELIQKAELDLCYRRQTTYCGVACIEFDQLAFEPADSDERNVERLRNIFKAAGCCRIREENRLSGYIDPVVLSSALKLSGISVKELEHPNHGSPPKLTLPAGLKVKCKEGKSRVSAAKTLLEEGDWVWAVKLYTKENDSTLHYRADEQAFEDLEIFYQLLTAQSENDLIGAGFWYSQVQGTKISRLKRFLNRNDEIVAALYEVVRVPGLRYGITFTMLYDCGSYHCEEELLHYLNYIRDTWFGIMDNDSALLYQVDRKSVETLQMRVPGICSQDLAELETCMQNGALFPFLTDTAKRQRIWFNILQLKYIIPTCFTFGRDRLFLKPLALAVSSILCPLNSGSLRKALDSAFSQRTDRRMFLQVRENWFQSSAGTSREHLNMGILQIILFALRHFPSLVDLSPLKERSRNVSTRRGPQSGMKQLFCYVAQGLGFETSMIRESTSEALDQSIYVSLAAYLSASERSEEMKSRSCPDMTRRSGRVFEGDHDQQRSSLFLPNLINHWTLFKDKSLVATFSTIFAFWGDLLRPLQLAHLAVAVETLLPLDAILMSSKQSSGLVGSLLNDMDVDFSEHDSGDNYEHQALIPGASNREVEFQKQIDSQNQCIQELLDQATNAETEKRALAVELTDKETIIKRSCIDKDQLSRQVEELQAEVASHEKITRVIQQTTEKNSCLQAELDKMRQYRGILEDEKQKLQTEVDQLQKESLAVQEFKKRIFDLGDENDLLSTKLQDIDGTKHRLERERSELLSTIDGLEDKLGSVSKTYDELRTQSDLLEQEKAASEAKVQSLQAKLQAASQNISLEAETRLLRYELRQKDERAQTLEAEVQRLRSLWEFEGAKKRKLNHQDRHGISFRTLNEDGSTSFSRKMEMSRVELKRYLHEQIRRNIFPLTLAKRGMRPEMAWQTIIGDGSYTIIEDKRGASPPDPSSHQQTGDVISSDTLLRKPLPAVQEGDMKDIRSSSTSTSTEL